MRATPRPIAVRLCIHNFHAETEREDSGESRPASSLCVSSRPVGSADDVSDYDYDLFVIGAGSGGVRASRMAAATGARVAVAEARHLGGTCVNVGCVPKKLMSYCAHFHEDFADAAGFGWTVGERAFDWTKLIARKNAEIERLNGVYKELLEEAGVELILGRAVFLDAHTVEVAGRRCTARTVLVAVGGAPWVPNFPGSEHVITSDQFFFLDELPRQTLVVGGGYIAVELAGILNGLGSEVVLSYRGDLFLRGFDLDLRRHLRDQMVQKGVALRFGSNVAGVRPARGGGFIVAWADGETSEVDQILYATGRRPLVQGLGLERAGVELTDEGAIRVDALSCTTAPSIYAIGDVTDRLNLTPVALHEAMCLVRTLFHDDPTAPVHRDVASAVFSQPPIGTVGLSEDAARAGGFSVVVFQSEFRPLKHTLSGNPERTLMKLVVDEQTDRVLGVHMVGPDAGEIIQGFAVAVKCGATKDQFDATIGVHPTSAEEFVTMRNPRR